MRWFLPCLAALASTTSASSFNVRDSLSLVRRQTNEAPNSTTFDETPLEQATFEDNLGTASPKFAFAVVVNPKNGDVRFRLAGPSIYSWIAVGTGQQMAGSLMFIMYRGNKNAVVLSGRLSDGEVEPYQSNKVNITMVEQVLHDNPNGVGDDGLMRTTGLCKGCMNVAANKIDVNNQAQQFIYALGPRERNPHSDATNAPLRRHIYYGHFALDITRALGVGIPTFRFNTTDTDMSEGGLSLDPDFAESAHTFVMLLSFVIVIPLGIFFIRTLERVKIHMMLQTLALILIVVGFVTGIVISRLYQRSMNFNSAHQIIGIIVFCLIITQWTAGFMSHRRFSKTGQNIKVAMQAHKLVIGPLAFALGIVNASLGFRLAIRNPLINALYLPVMFIIIVLLFITQWKKHVFMSRWGSKRKPTSPYNGGEYGQQITGVAPGYGPPGHETPSPYQHTGAYATRSDIALTPMDAPPAYDSTPQKPREFA